MIGVSCRRLPGTELSRTRRVLHFGLDPEQLRCLADSQERGLWRLQGAAEFSDCLALVESRSCDVLVTAPGPVSTPIERLAEGCLRSRPALPILVLARRPDYDEAMKLARCGVTEYLPWSGGLAAEIEKRIERACQAGAGAAVQGAETADALAGIVGSSPAMREVINLVRLIAPRHSTVLLTGRTGTGKELVARAIHEISPRRAGPMVMANCGAIPENLMEAEFFGHTKGAFTGAIGQRIGRFEQAHRGTIFLDEVGELPLEMQSKLLRVLQEREVQRIGASETIRVDVRVVAATNRDLNEMVRQGMFREDLYYRLNVVPLRLPSLSERAEDVPLLVEHLLTRVCERENLKPKKVGLEAMRRILEYAWPGNVRQLENAIEKAVALSGDRLLLYPSDFPIPTAPIANPFPVAPRVTLPAGGIDFDSVVTGLELDLLRQALRRSGGNKKRAADLLGIKRTTFTAKLRSLETVEEKT